VHTLVAITCQVSNKRFFRCLAQTLTLINCTNLSSFLLSLNPQSAIRRYLSMKAFKQVLRANTVTRIIQTKWREVRTRQRFTATKFLVIKVQAVFRGVIVRKSVVIQTRNAIQIQTAWRRHCALIRYSTEVRSFCQDNMHYNLCKI
jgi:hypothetical protein